MNVKTINSTQVRLTKIKKLLDTQKVLEQSVLRQYKGSSYVYGYLVKNKIISHTTEGYKWNDKIPVTVKLAKTIYEYVAERNIEYRDRKLSEKAKLSKKVIKSKSKTTVSKVKPVNKTRETVKLVNTKDKAVYEFSLLWGAFKIRRMK
jgi:hypothetical protein